MDMAQAQAIALNIIVLSLLCWSTGLLAVMGIIIGTRMVHWRILLPFVIGIFLYALWAGLSMFYRNFVAGGRPSFLVSILSGAVNNYLLALSFFVLLERLMRYLRKRKQEKEADG